jgi:hypothetical protein
MTENIFECIVWGCLGMLGAMLIFAVVSTPIREVPIEKYVTVRGWMNDNPGLYPLFKEKIQDGELSNRDFKELKKERDVLENKMILNSLPLFKEPIPEKKIEQTTEDWSEPTEDWSEPVKWDK